jgi:hypothetical protein
MNAYSLELRKNRAARHEEERGRPPRDKVHEYKIPHRWKNHSALLLGAQACSEQILTEESPPLDPEVRAELMEGYREDILRLQQLIGRDLSAWWKEEGEG